MLCVTVGTDREQWTADVIQFLIIERSKACRVLDIYELGQKCLCRMSPVTDHILCGHGGNQETFCWGCKSTVRS